MKKMKLLKSNQAGFSLVELIIVIAIIAVLCVAIAPNMLQYVAKTKRTTDVYAARQLADIMERVVTIDNPDSGAGASPTATVSWDKGTSLAATPTTILEKTFVEYGSVPLSRLFPDYFWTLTYDTSTGDVISIHIGAASGDTTHELFPDGQDYIDGDGL